MRRAYFEAGFVRSTKTEKAKPHSKFETYFAFQEKVISLREPGSSHRYLAIRRGQAEGELQLAVGGPPEDAEFEARLVASFEAKACTVPDSPGAEVLRHAGRIAFKNNVRTSIENEVHRVLKEAADAAAAQVFAENVKRLLLEPPFGPKPVLGVDPGIRTGCKLVTVDAAGAFTGSEIVFLQTDEQKTAAAETLVRLARERGVAAVAVGNGTGGREAEVFARAALRQAGLDLPVVLVSEAGASVYSTSEVARAEFPDLDATVRGAISIARRLQDPLAELVKIEPRSIGVGQYQHDVAHAALQHALDAVIESCVNGVGVNLNTASPHLLAHVAGIGPALAAAIVQQREKQGPFRSRQQLLEVKHFGPKAFEQAAGFLRIADGEIPLDNTAVHPERYAALEALAARLGHGVAELLGPGAHLVREAVELKDELGTFTWEDIVSELEKPGRDPARFVRAVLVPRGRAEARGPQARHDPPGDRQQRHELRRIRGYRRPPGRARPRLAARQDLREGAARGRAAGRPRGGPRPQGRPREEADLALDASGRAEARATADTTAPAAPRETGPGGASVRGTRRRRRARVTSVRGPASAQPEGASARERAAPPATPAAPPAAEGASGPRPDRAAAGRSERPPRPGEARRPTGRPPTEKRPESRRPAFNNPFAVLATLKPKKG